MARKSGLAWHKRQLAALRLIIAEADDEMPGDSPTNKNLGQQFLGACRPIDGARIPAYHDPLAAAVKGGAALFGITDDQHVRAALAQIKSEKKATAKKKKKSAQ